MTFPGRAMVQGSFTASASLPQAININCGFIPSRVEIVDQTQWGIGSSAFLQSAVWDINNPTQTNVTYANSASTLFNLAITSNGISSYSGQNAISQNSFTLGAVVTAGAATKATACQITSTAHGLQTGDQILVHGPFTAATAMNQLGGLIFSVTVTGANTFTIPINTNTSNFTATTVTTYQKVIVKPYFYPNELTITGMTAANPMVITTSTVHNMTVGQVVRIRVPSVFGMTQANNVQAQITAVTSTTLTVNIDSSAYTAFAWPAVTSLPWTPATVTPIGSGPSLVASVPYTWYVDPLEDSTANQSFNGFTIGSAILQTTGTFIIAASDLITWTAWRQDA